MRRPIVGLAIACMIPVTLAAEPPLDKKESPATIRKKYEKLPVKLLKIVEPIEITEVLYYKDGGSIGLKIRDAKKQEHPLSMDGRKRGVFPIILNTIYPTEEEPAKRLEIRGPEEAELYAILLRWANRHEHRDAFFDMKNELPQAKYGNLWEIRVFFERLERRYVQ